MSLKGSRRDGSSAVRRFVRRAGYASVLLPASVVTVGAVAAGRTDSVRGWWSRAGERGAAPGGVPGRARLLTHAVLCVPLGLVALVPVGTEILFVLRGVLYPLVDRGPYDHSWGGPGVGGAWLVHFAVSLPFAAAGVGALWLLGLLHIRLAGRLWGREAGPGAFVATAVASVCGIAAAVAWLHQL